MAEVYFSLGSNLGDRHKYLKAATVELKKKLRDARASSVYQTKPWGKEDQPSFLNMCMLGRTELEPEELIEFIKSIESKLGRTHREKWGPREIDIDLLFYGQRVMKSPKLTLPHPHVAERPFVLVPLAEIAAELIHPKLKEPISSLVEKLDVAGIERFK